MSGSSRYDRILNHRRGDRNITPLFLNNQKQNKVKRIIFSIVVFLVALLSLTVSYAHIPTQECSKTGWYTYIWSDLGSAKAVQITWGLGRHTPGYDTTIYNLNLNPVTTFQAPVGQDVTFTFSDGYVTDFDVKASKCNLPILLSTFNVNVEAPGQYKVDWTTQLESNNDFFTIQAATDTGSWKIVAIVKSFYPDGNGSTPHDYSVQVNADSSNPVEAGLGNKFLIFLLGGGLVFLIIGKIRIGRWTGIIVLFSLTFTSCSKTNNIQIPLKTYKYFRLSQTDKDGTTVTFPVTQVNN